MWHLVRVVLIVPAAYSLEDWHGMDRYHFNALVTPQDFNDTYAPCSPVGACSSHDRVWPLCDSYLPGFESCVRDGNASAIMCSYNAVRARLRCAGHCTGLALTHGARVCHRRTECRLVRTRC